MPRKRWFYVPGVAVHVVQRGHSRKPTFFEPDDSMSVLVTSHRNLTDRFIGCFHQF